MMIMMVVVMVTILIRSSVWLWVEGLGVLSAALNRIGFKFSSPNFSNQFKQTVMLFKVMKQDRYLTDTSSFCFNPSFSGKDSLAKSSMPVDIVQFSSASNPHCVSFSPLIKTRNRIWGLTDTHYYI